MSEYRFYLYHEDLGKWTKIPEPKGWDTMKRTRKRFGVETAIGSPWHGLFYDFTSKLSFIKSGKRILQNLFELYGIEQDILLKIEKKDTRTHRFNVEYEGKINLSTYQNTTTDVIVNVEQTGFTQRIKNGNDIKVNIEATETQDGKVMSAAPMITLPLHSKVIRKFVTRDIQEIPEEFDGELLLPTVEGPGTFYIIPKVVTRIDDKLGIIPDYPLQYQATSFEDDLKYNLKIQDQQSGYISIYTKLKWQISGARFIGEALPYNAVIYYSAVVVHKRGDTILSTNNIPLYTKNNGVETSNGFFNSGVQDTEIGFGFDFQHDDEFYWYLKLITNVETNYLYFDASAENSISYLADTVTPATDCQAIMIHEALQRTIESLTSKTNSFYSKHFGRTDLGYDEDGAGSLRAITSVNKIRGIDKPLQCTLSGLITTAWALDAIGVGIEKIEGKERVRVEPLLFWYAAKPMMRLDYILDIEKGLISELYFNQAEGGIDKWGNEQIANLDEPNSKKEWTFPITQVKQNIDLKSPYITGAYTIEFARREREQPTKDTRADEENVIIRVLRDGENFVPEKDEAFSSVTGIISPVTSYNLQDSPARCFRRHGRVLRSFLEKQKTQVIKFQAGEANNLMTSQLLTESAPVVENADILISDLDKPIFLAERYRLRARLDYEQLIALNETDSAADENAYGFVEFSKSDKSHVRGYLLSASLGADSNEVILELIRANI
jgi:hypothetical protein